MARDGWPTLVICIYNTLSLHFSVCGHIYIQTNVLTSAQHHLPTTPTIHIHLVFFAVRCIFRVLFISNELRPCSFAYCLNYGRLSKKCICMGIFIYIHVEPTNRHTNIHKLRTTNKYSLVYQYIPTCTCMWWKLCHGSVATLKMCGHSREHRATYITRIYIHDQALYHRRRVHILRIRHVW